MKKFISLFFVLLFSGLVFAQSADVITEILDTDKVTYGQVAYLSAVNQELIGEDASYQEAVAALIGEGQLKPNVQADVLINMEKLASLYMKMWPGKAKGGFMYRITKAPRYAFKQLKEDGLISQFSDPWDYVTGREALNILTACMIAFEGDNTFNKTKALPDFSETLEEEEDYEEEVPFDINDYAENTAQEEE